MMIKDISEKEFEVCRRYRGTLYTINVSMKHSKVFITYKGDGTVPIYEGYEGLEIDMLTKLVSAIDDDLLEIARGIIFDGEYHIDIFDQTEDVYYDEFNSKHCQYLVNVLNADNVWNKHKIMGITRNGKVHYYAKIYDKYSLDALIYMTHRLYGPEPLKQIMSGYLKNLDGMTRVAEGVL